jgi:parvulin-like peptidyl-prolyl isomerase
MARRKPRPQEEQRELTRKEHRLRSRDRQRNRRIMMGAGIAMALALLLVIAGLVSEFVIRPNSAVATVAGTQIITRDFWKRTFLEQNRLQNQLARMTQLEQQFGGQGFFTTQINQLQATLSSPFSLGVQVLDQMIREEVVRQKAAERGITVTEEEINDALREEVAGQQGAVTVPQATSTAEAAAGATVTAESWTPTPTATVDASGAVTATATPLPTPVPPPTSPILTDEQYTQGLQALEKNLQDIANMSLDEYRKIVAARLLDEKLSKAIGEEQVAATEEQVHARHILLTVSEPVTPTTGITGTNEITASAGITPEIAPSGEVTNTGEVSATQEVTATTPVTTTEVVTTGTEVSATSQTTAAASEVVTGEVTATNGVTATGAATTTVTNTTSLTDTAALTATGALTDTGAMTGSADISDTQPVTYTEAEALALALDLRQRLENGEDFATLAAEYSDDTGSAAKGGDLGWFGRGKMVPVFEDAAFSLAPGEISQPIRSDFGYHIIQVLEKDPNHPKDENSLQQERTTAYENWLKEQIAATPVERTSDLASKLPRDLKPAVQQAPVAATPAPVEPAAPLTQ